MNTNQLSSQQVLSEALSLDLHIGDPVRIAGNVSFAGETGVIVETGINKAFVVVQMDSDGSKYSFHSSDVEYNENGADDDSMMEGTASHAELAKLARDAYIQATRKGNGPMAAHYLKQHMKHKADAAKKQGVAEGSDVEYIVVIQDQQGKRSIRISALTPTDAKEKAEAQGYRVLKVKDPQEKGYFREQGVAEAIPYALSAANANAEYERTKTFVPRGYKSRVDTEVSGEEEYRLVMAALKKLAQAKGQHVEVGLSNTKMSIFSKTMDSDALDEFVDMALEEFDQGVTEGSTEHDIASLQKHFDHTVAYDAASHGPAMMQRRDKEGKLRQLVRQPNGNYMSTDVTEGSDSTESAYNRGQQDGWEGKSYFNPYSRIHQPDEWDDYKSGYQLGYSEGENEFMTEQDAVGEPNTDDILYYLTSAHRHLQQYADSYQDFSSITRVYNNLRHDLKAGDYAGFQRAYDESMVKYPDASVELIDAMFVEAGLPEEQGTYEQFIAKCCGVSESHGKRAAMQELAEGENDYHLTNSWTDRGQTHKRWDKDYPDGSPADRHQSSIEMWQERGQEPRYHAHHRIEKGYWTNQSSRESPTTTTHNSKHPSLDDAKTALAQHTAKMYGNKQGMAEGSTNDYFKRRKDEEGRIAGTKPPAKRTPKQTDYEKKRKQQDMTEGKEDKIAQLKRDYADKLRWSKESHNPREQTQHRIGAQRIKDHLLKQYGVDVSSATMHEAHKLGDLVMMNYPSLKGVIGRIGEIRHGLFKGAEKTYTIDYQHPKHASSHQSSIQLRPTQFKAHKQGSLGESTFTAALTNLAGDTARDLAFDDLLHEARHNKTPPSTPRNFVAKHATTSGAGKHKDAKRAAKQGERKHKGDM